MKHLREIQTEVVIPTIEMIKQKTPPRKRPGFEPVPGNIDVYVDAISQEKTGPNGDALNTWEFNYLELEGRIARRKGLGMPLRNSEVYTPSVRVTLVQRILNVMHQLASRQ